MAVIQASLAEIQAAKWAVESVKTNAGSPLREGRPH
jgi:hypothetical protein